MANISVWLVYIVAVWCVQICSSLSTKEKAIVVRTHNALRAKVSPTAGDMRPLVWDNNAANVAQEWADACNQKHRTNLITLGMGENLAFSSKPYIGNGVDSGIYLWYNEVKDYIYSSGTCKPKKVCGHYTQVVDTRSLAVGCATNKKKCPSGYPYMFVCNYSPAGNFNGMKPYQAGAPCSKCPDDTKFCMNNFCSDCKPGGNCKCKLDCGPKGKKDSKRCSCKCKGAWGTSCANPCKNSAKCTGPGYHKFPNSIVCTDDYFSTECAAKCQPGCS